MIKRVTKKAMDKNLLENKISLNIFIEKVKNNSGIKITTRFHQKGG